MSYPSIYFHLICRGIFLRKVVRIKFFFFFLLLNNALRANLQSREREKTDVLQIAKQEKSSCDCHFKYEIFISRKDDVKNCRRHRRDISEKEYKFQKKFAT